MHEGASCREREREREAGEGGGGGRQGEVYNILDLQK